MKHRKIIVVGAGIGGLATAWWLLKKGFDVTVLEASDRPGGRVKTIKRKGDLVDVGAQCFHDNYRNVLGLMKDLKMTHLKKHIGGNLRMTLADGSFKTINPSVPYLKTLRLNENVKLLRFMLRYILFGRRFSPWQISENIPNYDNTGIVELFNKPSDRRIKDYFLNMLSIGVGGCLPETISLYHFIRIMRNTSSGRNFGLSLGMSSLAEALAKQIPIRYEDPVHKLVMEKGCVVGVEMEKNRSVEKADHVV